MLSRNLLKIVAKVSCSMKRNISISAIRCERLNPVKVLFQEKLAEYLTKSSGGKMVEPTPEILKELERELKLVLMKYDAEKPEDLEEFPDIDFEDPHIDSILLIPPKPVKPETPVKTETPVKPETPEKPKEEKPKG